MMVSPVRSYAAEGIQCSHISFPDNQASIDLIENKIGVMGLLDEYHPCRRPNPLLLKGLVSVLSSPDLCGRGSVRTALP